MPETSDTVAVRAGDRDRGDLVGDAAVAPVIGQALTVDTVVDLVVRIVGERIRVGGAKTGGEGVAGDKCLCIDPFFFFLLLKKKKIKKK